MTTAELYKKARSIYPGKEDECKAYVQGCLDMFELMTIESGDFYETLATKLKALWPPGEKGGKWAWRGSTPELVKRLEFLWKERNLKGKYTLDDCLMAARRYLAQYEENTKYMEILKYFIFKQKKLVASDGRITYTYKSSFADMLENNPVNLSSEWEELFESSDTYNQGELI